MDDWLKAFALVGVIVYGLTVLVEAYSGTESIFKFGIRHFTELIKFLIVESRMPFGMERVNSLCTLAFLGIAVACGLTPFFRRPSDPLLLILTAAAMVVGAYFVARASLSLHSAHPPE